MWVCECEGYVNVRCFWYEETFWLLPFKCMPMNVKSYSFYNALLMCLDGWRGCGISVWLFYSWQQPWGLFASVFFMAEREKMPQWRSSFSSCFVSSPLPLLTTAPTLFCSSSQRLLLLWCIVIHCLVLKNEDNACWNTAQAFVGIFLFLHLSSSCLGYKKTKTKVLKCIVWGYGSSS